MMALSRGVACCSSESNMDEILIDPIKERRNLGFRRLDIVKRIRLEEQLRIAPGLEVGRLAPADSSASVRTAHRHWAFAKAWLYQELRGE